MCFEPPGTQVRVMAAHRATQNTIATTALNNITQVTFCHSDPDVHLPVRIVILQVDGNVATISNKP